MNRTVLLACMAGLTLTLTSPAMADDPDGCDMLCKLRSYLATDHMTPAPADVTATRAGAGKHARKAAATRKPKSAVAAAAAPSAPAMTEAKPIPAAEKESKLHPYAPTAVADAKPAPERHRLAEKAVVRSTKSAISAKSDLAKPDTAAARASATPAVVAEKAPKRATRVATLAAGRPSPRLVSQTATPVETTTSSVATIPGSAPLVAPGFR